VSQSPLSAAAPALSTSTDDTPRSAVWSLSPGASWSGEIGQVYRFTLAGNTFLELEIEQRGVDVVVEVRDDRDELVLAIDRPNGDSGIEPILLVAARPTEFRLVTRPWQPAAAPGSFGVRVQALRPASARDLASSRAWHFLSRAEVQAATSKTAAGPAADFLVAAEAFEAAHDPIAAARTLVRLVEFQRSHLERASAPRLLERALDHSRRAQASDVEAEVWLALGRARADLDLLAPAIDAYQQALALWRKLGNRHDQATTLNDLAWVFQRQGRAHSALECYTDAIALWQELGHRVFEATTRTNLGHIYVSFGYRRQAVIHYRKALALLGTEGSLKQRAITSIRLADALLFLDSPAVALELLDQALALSRAARDPVIEAMTFNSIGLAERRAQHPERALESFEKALDLYVSRRAWREAAPVAANLGLALIDLGRPRPAHDYFVRSADYARRTNSFFHLIEALNGLARVERLQGRLGSARDRLEEALKQIELLRQGPALADQRSEFLAVRHESFDLMVTTLGELELAEPGRGHAAAAFATSERSKARGLLDSVFQASDRHEDARLRGEREKLDKEIDQLHGARLSELAQSQNLTTAYDEALLVSLQELDTLEATRRRLAPNHFSPPDLGDLAALFDQRTLFLEYFLGAERGWLFLFNAKGLKLIEMPRADFFDQRVADVLNRLGLPPDVLGRAGLEQALAELGVTLLAPIEAELAAAERVVIVPSGALRRLSFAALTRPSTNKALIESHEISYLPSAAVLLEWRRKRARRPPGQGMALISDPVFTAHDERVRALVAAAPQAAGDRISRIGRELEAIRALGPPAPFFEASGFAAAPELFLSGQMRPYRWLHISGHGFWDDAFPELSSILLSGFDARGRPRDGHLRAYRIRRLELSADLVNLSACLTGTSTVLGGEGVVGLSRSFFDAGAASVLMTLWPVHDPATTEFNRRFYRHLIAGKSPSAALRAAQLALIHDSPWPEPFFWAGFALYGDWQPAPDESSAPSLENQRSH
jgi:CHAT domain-containing protein/tetratricopeptide (TPR) repeat protein